MRSIVFRARESSDFETMSRFKSVLVYLLHNFIIQRSVCTNSSTWTLLNETDVSYNTSVILENSIPLMMCLLRCQNTLACIAIQVNEVSSNCELLKDWEPNGTLSLSGRAGWTFYEKDQAWKEDDVDWIDFGQSRYFIGNSSLTFTDSEMFCVSLQGAHLINIETEKENMFIRNVIRPTDVHAYWMGMTDEQNEGDWKLVPSGEPATFTAWGPGEPNLGRIGNCAVLYESHDYKWADYSCTITTNLICEKPSS